MTNERQKPVNDEYRSNYDQIFGKKVKQPVDKVKKPK